MKKMIYTKELDEQIIFHEDHMLALYLEKIKEYKPLFEENGVSLKTGLIFFFSIKLSLCMSCIFR